MARKKKAKRRAGRAPKKKAAKKKRKAKKAPKLVYFFGAGKAEGSAKMKADLGGKGANLAEMSRMGLRVPPGFTIKTEICDLYYKDNKKYPPGLKEQVHKNLERLENLTGKKLGDPLNPLLVSVRSGAALSMPGMMETILNLGLNDVSVEGLANVTGNRRFALDAYRRFILMYGATAMGVARGEFDKAFDDIKERRTRLRLSIPLDRKVQDTEVNEKELEELIPMMKEVYRRHTGEDLPQDPTEQLWGSISAVVESWMGDKAVTYRSKEKITGLKGTAVNVQTMVFGNTGRKSGSGVAFTRDPSSGEDVFYGDYLVNAQGEDVVAGIRTPIRLDDLAKVEPELYAQLFDVRNKLEKHYRDMQDLEFTIENGDLYILQTRTGKRTPAAAFKMAVEMVRQRLITKKEALMRVQGADIERLFYPVIDPGTPAEELQAKFFVSGIDAVPGAASGQIVFTAEDAEEWAENGKEVILVRKETSPEDVGGMHAAKGILTATGGKTSHAAVVARGWGKCCIVGAEKMSVDHAAKQMTAGGVTLNEGDYITLNGSTGDVYKGRMNLVRPTMPDEYHTMMKWADQVRRMKVRANADTPQDAAKAVELGAQGIGLCRTEHMFFREMGEGFSREEADRRSKARQIAIQQMIIAETTDERKKALDKLLPFQRDDFTGIFKAMAGKPVTIRLLDPPLHEFTPKTAAAVAALSQATGTPEEEIRKRSEQLHEVNPMLGHRGCRLPMTYPEMLEMQVRAIIEAAIICVKQGVKVMPEIMIPVLMDPKEMRILEQRTRAVADPIIMESGVKLKYLVGTMIELPRAALLADKIAESAEFFSFGTNDLTQTTLGVSRDDYGSFIAEYTDENRSGIFAADPFQVLDEDGVGVLVEMGTKKGRAGRAAYAAANKLPKSKAWLKVGICGEHGGEPASVKFCNDVGMDYVSCSPLRVPIARLAAAQATILETGAKKPRKKKAKKKAAGKRRRR